MLTAKQALYVEKLVEDFFNELNYIAGVPNQRTNYRNVYLGIELAYIHSSLTRSNPEVVHPSTGEHFLHERITEAAKMASELYQDIIERSSPDELNRFVVAGVDRLLEYVTCPDSKGILRSWHAQNFLIGLSEGDPRRWVLAIPNRTFNDTEVIQRDNNIDIHYAIVDTARKQQRQAILGRSRSSTINSEAHVDVCVDNNEFDTYEEKSASLHRMVARFEIDFQLHIGRIKHTPLVEIDASIPTTPKSPTRKHCLLTTISECSEIEEEKSGTLFSEDQEIIPAYQVVYGEPPENLQFYTIYQYASEGIQRYSMITHSDEIIRDAHINQLNLGDYMHHTTRTRSSTSSAAILSEYISSSSSAAAVSEKKFFDALHFNDSHAHKINRLESALGYQPVMSDDADELFSDSMPMTSHYNESVMSSGDLSYHQDSPVVMDLKARLHLMLFRKPLTKVTDQLSFMTPALSMPLVEPKVLSQRAAEGVQHFHAYMSQFVTGRLSALHLLIQGEPGSGKDAILNYMPVYLKEKGIDANWMVWLPISLKDLEGFPFDSTQLFLPQYLRWRAGYSTMGVTNLQQNYRFLIYFDGIDECKYPELIPRIYFGEETADWPLAKVVMTAGLGWIPPHMATWQLPMERITLTHWDEEQVAQCFQERWVRSLQEGEGSGTTYNDFFMNNPELQRLASPFSMRNRLIAENDTTALLSASPALLNMLYDLFPLLIKQSKEQWPQHHTQLYALWLKHHLGESYANVYPEIRRIALALFSSKAPFLKEVVTPQSAPLQNWLFISGTDDEAQGQTIRRYAFTQNSWRDFFIAQALWECIYDMHHNDASTYLWNQRYLEQEYPQVLYFLIDMLDNSREAALDADFLKKRWFSNGRSNCEKAYINTRALLSRSRPHDALVLHEAPNASASSSVSSASGAMVPSLEEAAKHVACGRFVQIRPHWEMRFLEGLGSSMSQVTKRAFGKELGHGAGIAVITPNYLQPDTDNSDKRYIYVNAQDAAIGTTLITKVHEGIEQGNKPLVHILVPQNWGYYQKDTLLEVNRRRDLLDLYHANAEYLNILQRYILRDDAGLQVTPETALSRMEQFTWREDEFIIATKNAYIKKCEQEGQWFDSNVIVQASELTIQRRWSLHEMQLKARIKSDVTWLREALSQNITTDAMPALFEERAQAIEADELRVNDTIETFHNRELQLKIGIRERFKLLMHAFDRTRQIYEEQEAAIHSILTHLTEASLPQLMAYFKGPYMAEVHQLTYNTLTDIISENRKHAFETWILSQSALNAQWQRASNTRKQLCLTALSGGDITAAITNMSLIFTSLDATAKKNLHDVLHAIIENELKRGFERYLTQDISTLSAWQKMSLNEQAIFYQRIMGKLDTPDNFIEVITAYPNLFPQPSDDYIKRFLRLGLAIDACLPEDAETLLFKALKKLGSEETRLKKSGQSDDEILAHTECFHDVMEHIVNTGATVLVSNNQSAVNTPLKYVEEQCNQHNQTPLGKRWLEIKKSLEDIRNWLELQEGEKRLVTAIHMILENIEGYKKIINGTGDSWLSKMMNDLSTLLRSAAIHENRQRNIQVLPGEIENLLNDRFVLRYKMLKFINDLTSREYPTRFRMGRMASAVVIPLQNLIRDLDANIPQSHALVEHPPQRRSTGSFSFMSSFGFGGGQSDAKEKRLARELREEKRKGEVLVTRNQRLDENAKRAEERNQQLEEQLKRNAKQIRQLCERNSDEMLILDNDDEEEEKTSGIYASQPRSTMFSQSSSSSSASAAVAVGRDRSASVTDNITGRSNSVSVPTNNVDEHSAAELVNESETAYNLTNT